MCHSVKGSFQIPPLGGENREEDALYVAKKFKTKRFALRTTRPPRDFRHLAAEFENWVFLCDTSAIGPFSPNVFQNGRFEKHLEFSADDVF